jgi:ribonuclease HII
MQQLQADFLNGLVAGLDEAGRGPLAGPVVAAAVILHPEREIEGLCDSKKLCAARREVLEADIKRHALCWSVAWSDRAEIDALNILGATMLAMRRAIMRLPVMPQGVKVDGNRLPDLRFRDGSIDGLAIVGGDAQVDAISAASIIAKTERDRIMMAMHARYPGYEFARHKGYCTELHQARLRELGPCAEHRRSFSPVRALA